MLAFCKPKFYEIYRSSMFARHTLEKKERPVATRVKSLFGQRFGRLVAKQHYVDRRIRRESWLCECDCGKKMVDVESNSLQSGDTISCGCDKRKTAANGIAGPTRKHQRGIRQRSTTYRFWRAMISCCINEEAAHYSDFGGRGIRVCAAWLNSYASFRKDLGERPGHRYVLSLFESYPRNADNRRGHTYSLRLKDGAGHFEPGNVQWAECPSYDPLDVERVRLDLMDAAKAKRRDPLIYAAQMIRYLQRT
jgi:hypothetical protein